VDPRRESSKSCALGVRAHAGELETLDGTKDMHGVPNELKALCDFVGTRLAVVDDLENIVYFRFASGQGAPQFDIGVEGAWELRARTGEVVAEGTPNLKDQTLAPVFQSTVIAAETRAPRSIAILFASGHTLEIFDSSLQYESFSIPHRNVYI
jgi:hypothetical protein